MWWSKQRKAKVASSKVVTGTGAATPPPSLIMALEARIMFDAAVVATVADAVVDTGHAVTPHFDVPREAPAAVDISARVVADSAPAASSGNVLFIDSRVTDAASLLSGVAADTQVVYLQAGKDGLQQMADYLTQHPGANSVQIIAHGNAGDLWLGTTYLSADNLAAHSEVLADIGSGVAAGGDILIYGCYTAQGERGLAFVNGLAQLTGRDIAASDDRTGAGGDWDLEIVTGSIESVNVLSAQSTAAYDWGLATWRATNNLDSGAGSLRAALALAQNGDIVTFNSSMTVQLSSELLINKNITVDGDLNDDGVADVTLDGAYRTRVIEINYNNTVTLDGLVITRGLVSGDGGNGGYGASGAMAGGIFNAGILTLNNVSVTSNAASGGGGGGGVTGAFYGGGGGGGGLGSQGGGHGGAIGPGTGTLGGQAGVGGVGGYGGGYDATHMGGRGGTSTGGAGGLGVSYYSNGGNGGTASNGTISIGGGGGGAGWDKVGGAGGNAAGGIYNAASGTLKIIGTSVISNNIGAGGGGGGGGGQRSNASNGGIGGRGVGAIWNKGTLLVTAANFATMSGNAAGSGAGGIAWGGGSNGTSPTAMAAIYNDGGLLNTAYVEPPIATIVMSDTALKIGDTSQVTITFSKPVEGFSNADLTIPNGTLTAVSSADGGITWTATFTPTSSIADTTNVITLDNTGVTAISDGVAGTGTTSSSNYSIDTQRPTATIVMSDTDLKIGDTSQVTITFSEAVTGLTNDDLTITNGTLSNVGSANGGTTWTATFTPNANITDASNLISLDNTRVADGAGNAGFGSTESNNYAIDTARPTATIVVADNRLGIGETTTVTITFSEAVTGFSNEDLTVDNGTLSAVSSADGGITWTATFTPSSDITDATNVISLDKDGIVDVAGNAGTGTIASNNYAIDTLRPTATIVVSDNALKIGETSLVTITFGEAVTGFTNQDLTIANGTLSAVSSNDGGVTWTATFTPTSNITNASNLISLDNSGVSDAVGNAGIGTSNSNNYAIDTLRPTAIIEVANSNLGIGVTSLVTITFSEAVTGFTLTDLTANSGTLSNLRTSDNITFTATLTPAAGISQVNNHIVLNNPGVLDTAGNAGTGNTNSNAYSVDSLRPTATIVLANPTLAAGQTSLVIITFNEAVRNFDNTDLNVPNGTLSAVSSSDGGVTWTATFTPTAGIRDSTNIITLNNTGYSDLANNAGVGVTNSANFSIDTVRPTASIVVANPALAIGGTSLVTITFNEAVTGFTNQDLTIANGSLTAVSSSDGGMTWTATFTPDIDITDASNVITLTNSGVQNAAGNVGSGTTESNNYAVDTVRPTASIVVSKSSLSINDTSLVTITFSEPVPGFTGANLNISNGTLSGLSSADGGVTWTATFTPMGNISDTTNVITLDNIRVVDAAGNTGTGDTTSNNFIIDTRRPTATIVVSDPVLTLGETSQVTITFSEAVSGFTLNDLSASHGSLSYLSSSDGGITWTATLTPNENTTSSGNVITLANTGIADLAGNTGVGTTNSTGYSIDTSRPTASIVVSNSMLNLGSSSLVTITFNQAVTGFSNADLTIANGTLSAVSSSDGGLTWTATFTPTSNISDATNLITLDNSGVQNPSGNVGSGTTDSNNYEIDTLRPTATIVVADTALGIGQTSLVTITFSEAVTGFTNADLTIANGTLSAVSSSDGGITWTATFTPAAGITDTSNIINLDYTGIADKAGNTGSGSTDSNNYAVDGQRPTATIVMTDSDLRPGETALVTITFSEAVTGFDNSDLSIANGTLSDVSSSDGGITWTATFTPNIGVTDLTNLIVLNNTGITDQAGNTGTGTTNSVNYQVQTQVPTATIVVADTALKSGETSLVTITFNDAVSGFDNSDLTIANGTLSNVSSSDGGITWTATFTPTSNITDSSNLITLNNAGVSNLSGNSGVGTTDSNNFAIDTALPIATIVVADSGLGIGETTTVTITFSEAVSGFDLSDISVANATLSNLTSSDGGVTWTATLTPTAGINDETNLIVIDTAGVQDLAGNLGASIAISNNYRLDVTRPTATIVTDPVIGIGQSGVVTITFNEVVTGLDLSDFVVSNGVLSGLITNDGGKTWTATLTPSVGVQSASNLITLDTTLVQDLAGNIGTTPSSSGNYVIDTVRPTSSIVVADGNLQAGESTNVTITFSEAVSGLNLSDLSVVNGSLSNLASSDGGKTWTATLTPSVDVESTSNLITLDNTAVQDVAGNSGSGSTASNSYAIDTLRPTAAIVVADSNLQAGETTTVTITFNEAVSGFDLSDLSVVNGSLSNLASSDGGKTWTATLTPSANVESAANLITLNNAGVQDVAGNSGIGSTASNSYAIDTLRPTASIVVADSNLQAGETTTVTITFNEAVSGFDLSDLNVVNGSLSNLASSDGGKTWTATLTPSANVESAANLITLNNAGVQDAAGNSGIGSTASNSYAIDTSRPTATIVRDPGPTNAASSSFTITFSEPVSGVDAADFALLSTGSATATISSLVQVDSRTYRVLVKDINGVGNLSLVLKQAGSGITDQAGNQLASDQSSAPDRVVVLAPVFLVPAQPSYEFTDAADAIAPAASPMHNVVLGAVSGIQEQTLLTMQAQAQEQRPAIESSTHLLDLQQKLEQLNLEPPKLHAQEPFELNLLAGVVDPVVAAQAQLSDGSGLPSWLSFDPLTGVLKGKAPRGFAGTVEVRITLILEDGSSVSKVVRLQFERAPDAQAPVRPGSAEPAAPAGKPGLHAQFSQHQRDASLQQLMQQLAAVPMAATTTVESRQ